MTIRRLFSRLVWIFPFILLFLTVYLTKAALDIRETMQEGEVVGAEVLEIYQTDRVDVTYGYVRLRVPMGEGKTDRKLSLPLAFIQELKGRDSLDVLVRPGTDQEIVILDLARPQWRMAAINAAICFLGFIILTVALLFIGSRKSVPGSRFPVPGN